jgi:plasmid stabilization system protein ParE
MIGYRYLRPAEAEAGEAALYYNKEAGLGKAFLDDLEKRIMLLRRSPEIGTPIGHRVRKFVLSRFPYSIIYYIHGEMIIIAAVAHHKRKPNYWSDRLDDPSHPS